MAKIKEFPIKWDDVPVIIDLEYVSCYLLKISVQTLQNLCRAGKLPAFKIEKNWRIEKSALIEWINSNRVC